jgi:hypothetical protein
VTAYSLATDLGHICQTAAPYIKAANLLVFESNYDEEMLANGRYPHFLKKKDTIRQWSFGKSANIGFSPLNIPEKLQSEHI